MLQQVMTEPGKIIFREIPVPEIGDGQVLLLDNCPTALAFGTQGFAARGVDEPDTEVMQRGSREGFVETYQTNISLLRRRLKTT